MGDAVGELVLGAFVGAGVGAAVGTGVGASVGALLGAGVGAVVVVSVHWCRLCFLAHSLRMFLLRLRCSVVLCPL